MAYRRASTVAEVLEDHFGLHQWQLRLVVEGLAPGVERDEYGRISRVFVSARTGAGLSDLRGAIAEFARERAAARGATIPQAPVHAR